MDNKKEMYLALIPYFGWLIVLLRGFLTLKKEIGFIKAIFYVFLSYILIIIFAVIIIKIPLKFFMAQQLTDIANVVLMIICSYFICLFPSIIMIGLQKKFLKQ